MKGHALLTACIIGILEGASSFTYLHTNHERLSRALVCTRLLHQDIRLESKPLVVLQSSNANKEEGYVEADDFAAIQGLFNKYCDDDGLMTEKALSEMPPFSEMLVGTPT